MINFHRLPLNTHQNLWLLNNKRESCHDSFARLPILIKFCYFATLHSIITSLKLILINWHYTVNHKVSSCATRSMKCMNKRGRNGIWKIHSFTSCKFLHFAFIVDSQHSKESLADTLSVMAYDDYTTFELWMHKKSDKYFKLSRGKRCRINHRLHAVPMRQKQEKNFS